MLSLLIQVRWLDWRMAVCHRRIVQYGLNSANNHYLRVARQWLKTHEAISVLLDCPELPEVTQLRATLEVSRELDDTLDRNKKYL